MGILAKLKTVFRATLTEKPDFSAAGSEIYVPDEDAIEETEVEQVSAAEVFEEPERRATQEDQPQKENTDADLWGTTFAIEYVDSKGKGSVRRISMRHIQRREGRPHILSAHCHERNALRHFRFDRIHSIIDADGVVHDVIPFFAEELFVQGFNPDVAENATSREASPRKAEIGRPLADVEPAPDREPEKGASNADPSGERPGTIPRRIARDGLRILMAIARSDGHLHPAELHEVLAYIRMRAEGEGYIMSMEDETALTGYLKRQRPDEEVLDRCIEAMEAKSPEVQGMLIASAKRLIAADGDIHDEELRLLDELNSRIA